MTKWSVTIRELRKATQSPFGNVKSKKLRINSKYMLSDRKKSLNRSVIKLSLHLIRMILTNI